MSAKILGMICGAMGLLAGCGAAVTDGLSQDQLTTTGFVNPSASGAINIGLENNITNVVERVPGLPNSGYAIQTGAIADEGLFAVAGLLPAAIPTSRPSSGSVTYAGEYNLIEINDIDIVGDEIIGFPQLRSGNLDLTANFNNGTLQSQPGSGLTVNGTVNGADIGGTVIYNGVAGNLDGLIGGKVVVGAFHGEGNVGPGTQDDYMYAGGFIADR